MFNKYLYNTKGIFTSNKARRNKKEKGITLVALVITIIIIIILATVTIRFAFTDDGIIKRAEQAGEMYANDTEYTDSSMANVVSYLDGILNGVEGGETNDPEVPVIPGPTPEPPTGGTKMEDMTNGVIEIKWLSGNTNNVTENPNAPIIKTDLPSGTTMEQVVYDEGSNTWVTGTEYSYLPGTGSNDNTSSKWANAKVTKDGIDSYFVWIPRYAYRIIYFDSLNHKKEYQEGTLTEEEAVLDGKIIGYSDSRGIVDTQGRKIDSITSESNSSRLMVSEDYFMVHPAFTDEEENGGWDSQLPGIWVGKYETSLANKTDGTNIITNDAGTGNILLNDHPDKAIVIRPGYSSWRCITINNIYKNALSYSSELESHMLKNSEWGAVAYLTESKYGRNGNELEINNNESYTTGGGTGDAYLTNTSQSTTGNVYGIYDMKGNSNERVASYYNGSNNLTNGSEFASKDGQSTEYVTAYSGTTMISAYKYGDATYETNGWDGSSELTESDPFFSRGGNYAYDEHWAGIFLYEPTSGSSGNVSSSFRICLVI